MSNALKKFLANSKKSFQMVPEEVSKEFPEQFLQFIKMSPK